MALFNHLFPYSSLHDICLLYTSYFVVHMDSCTATDERKSNNDSGRLVGGYSDRGETVRNHPLRRLSHNFRAAAPCRIDARLLAARRAILAILPRFSAVWSGNDSGVCIGSVSYTHLDVYKRQVYAICPACQARKGRDQRTGFTSGIYPPPQH